MQNDAKACVCSKDAWGHGMSPNSRHQASQLLWRHSPVPPGGERMLSSTGSSGAGWLPHLAELLTPGLILWLVPQFPISK